MGGDEDNESNLESKVGSDEDDQGNLISRRGGDEGPLVSRMDGDEDKDCLLYTSPSPRDMTISRMPSSA